MKNKIKILFLIPTFGNGGAQRTVINIIKGLDDAFEKVIYVLENSGPYKNELPKDVKIIELNFFNLKKMRYSFFHFPFVLFNEKPDIVFSTLESFNLLSIFTKKILFSKSKHIVRRAENFDEKMLSNFTYMSTCRYTYKNADFVFALSNGVKNELMNYLDIHQNIDVIYNPVDINTIEIRKNDLIESNVFLDSFVIIYVGRLSSEKNPIEILYALKKLIFDYNFPVKLLVLGEGEEKEMLQNYVNKNVLNKYVEFLGFIDNPYKYIAKSDVYILPSKREGLGHTLLESMLCETPIISAKVESGPLELIEENVNGLFYELGNIEMLCEKIIYLANNVNVQRKFVRNGKEKVQAFSIEKISRQYQDVFRTIIKK